MSKWVLFLVCFFSVPVYAADSGSTPESPSGSYRDDALSGLLGSGASATAASAAPVTSHVDISQLPTGVSTDFFRISADERDRGLVGSALRFCAKQSGGLDYDLAGVGSINERQRTERILAKHTTMLGPDDEYETETLKQFLDRQTAATTVAISFITELQKFSRGTEVADIILKTQAAHQLLTIHQETTLAPAISNALTNALKTARRRARERLTPVSTDE